MIAISEHAPKPPPDRVSFSYRLINAARVVLFLVARADKAGVLAQVLQRPLNQARLPAQGVRPNDGELIWLINSAAAGALVR